VRELENWVERALIHSQDGITVSLDGGGLVEDDVPVSEAASSPEPDVVVQPLEQGIRTHIAQALRQCNGKVEGPNGAAQLLRMHPSTLWSKMRKLGIYPKDFRTN